MKRLAQHVMEACQGRTAIVLSDLTFSKAHNAPRPCDTLKLVEQPGPVPGAYKTDAQTQVHQIERRGWKFERTEGVHNVKGDAVGYQLSVGLGTSIVDH